MKVMGPFHQGGVESVKVEMEINSIAAGPFFTLHFFHCALACQVCVYGSLVYQAICSGNIVMKSVPKLLLTVQDLNYEVLHI
ncbi:hypothetical protein SLEP1_g20078 [Rubroshorea leprosula]|uniref:Uncharacterized protein n=1 Tax=Rubroshorea leprosula TaxID=152421 RepID=A0AAV5JDG6_9ROSI|nr:hypothetical protein SLEP1_g20078 [Rubroshorea leprosula]